MEEFGKLLANPAFWPVAFVWAIVQGILGTYAKEWIDQARTALPQRWRMRSRAAKERREKAVDELRGDREAQAFALAKETRYRLKSFACYGTALPYGITAMLFGAHAGHLERLITLPPLAIAEWLAALGLMLLMAMHLMLGLEYSFRASRLENAVDEAIRRGPRAEAVLAVMQAVIDDDDDDITNSQTCE